MSPGTRFGEYAEAYALEPADPWQYGLTPAAPVCKAFGCGRQLTTQEQLFGDKCSEHNKPGGLVNKANSKIIAEDVKYL